ncbi:MAG: hypothetical protein LC634_00645 [Sphingomonadales bacterium]|nr:hypothetical protein [Sphingomonadales bacterium]
MAIVRWIFWAAAIFGIAVIAPLYFLEGFMSANFPPPIARPENYYGFVGVTLASQFLYVLIALDPVRFRPVILVGMAGKLSFVGACAILYLQGRIALPVFAMSLFDLVWVVLFALAWRRIGRISQPA